MNFQAWNELELLSFFMVLIRISTLFVLIPLFSDKLVPGSVKVLLSITFSIILFPVLRSSGAIRIEDAAAWSQSAGSLILTLVEEVLVGVCIGFVSQLVFHAIQIAGDFISQLMGFSMASLYDPHLETQTVVLGQMFGALAMLTFLAVDGHHILLQAMIESFRLIPQGHLSVGIELKDTVVRLVGQTVLFGVQLSAPMSACMLLVNIVYGVLGRALPQLNILTLSMASSAFIGGFVLLVTYPGFQNGMSGIFHTHFEELKQFLVVYGGK